MSYLECIAIVLAGGKGSRLGKLTANTAKPAIHFGGQYRIIDFTLSNCTNSNMTTIGVLTQFKPTALKSHIGNGVPWLFNQQRGEISIHSPKQINEHLTYYNGTADAVYQSLDFIRSHSPKYVLILSGDHIYQMDYRPMLEYHKQSNLYAYSFKDYWRDVGTVKSLWDAHMDLLQDASQQPWNNVNWPLLTRDVDNATPIMLTSMQTNRSIISTRCLVRGRVDHSLLSYGVTIGEGSIIVDSVIMPNVHIGKNVVIRNAIVGENTIIRDDVILGNADNREITVIGENEFIGYVKENTGMGVIS
jgi:ADP-glucose pyrophosphorylase